MPAASQYSPEFTDHRDTLPQHVVLLRLNLIGDGFREAIDPRQAQLGDN